MKKPVLVAGIIFLNLFFIKTWAQVKLTSTQVKEILVHNVVGGLNGGRSADVKVVNEGGEWRSYLTRKTNSDRNPYRKSYDSISHKFIAVLNPVVLNNLLKGIAVIKPVITPLTFGLTPHQLIAELKNNAKLPVAHAPDFEKLITQKVIDNAIAKTVVEVDRTDDFEYCQIVIVTHHNDTVKIDTRELCPTKLPWTINNHATYDMAFNNFVVAAIGKEDVPNKETLSINSLKEAIYNYIDEGNPDTPIANFRWKYNYPANLKLLTEHFTIKKRFMYGNVYSCWLRSNTMPANASLEGRIDMTSQDDINSVIKYANLIDKYFKAGNFVFKYYGSRPDSHISFSYNSGQSPYHPLGYLSKKLPEVAKTDSTQTISFWISAPDDSSYWIMFPDNKSLLTYHSVTTPHGETAPIYPLQDPNANWTTKSNTYYLFDGAGKVLREGDRL